MKVLALGGCGEMGRHAVKTLLTYGMCENLVIADINENKAKEFAELCGPPVSWAKADVSDIVSLKKAMKDTDVVMNTVGPFYRFGVSVLNACIERGCHYLDINDDWEPTLDMLALNEKAEKKQITAVIGMGASPGISNMLAVKAMAEMDAAQEICTGWDLDSAKPEKIYPRPSAATVHGIHQLTGRIRSYQNGRFHDTRPIREIRLDYPGIGLRSAWTIGHPEAVTLPRYFPGLRSSTNVMTTSRINIFFIRLLASLVNTKIVSVERAAWVAERVEGAEGPVKTPEEHLKDIFKGKKRGLPPLFALATGKKNGGPAAAGCLILSAPAGGMGGATGVPLAVGVYLLARNILKGHGVFAPEGIVNPDDFFNALAPLCTPNKKGVGDLILITRSWEKREGGNFSPIQTSK